MITLEQVRQHINSYGYMEGVKRSKDRVKNTAEVFTPTELVNEMLDCLPEEVFTDPEKTFLDPACGDGQFLGQIIIRKMENGASFEQALRTTYGVELMKDNVKRCKERLLCGQTHLKDIVEQNIVCADSLTYDYSFKPKRKIKRWASYELA